MPIRLAEDLRGCLGRRVFFGQAAIGGESAALQLGKPSQGLELLGALFGPRCLGSDGGRAIVQPSILLLLLARRQPERVAARRQTHQDKRAPHGTGDPGNGNDRSVSNGFSHICLRDSHGILCRTGIQ